MSIRPHLTHQPTSPEPATVTTTTTPATPAKEAAWLRLGAALAEHASIMTERLDLLVTITETTSAGVPGMFTPATATIELDRALFGTGVDPESVDPDEPGDRDRYPAAWGVLTHESAHARHSLWQPPLGSAGSAGSAAAELLEETRAEAAHCARRPDDTRWLRAAATHLILDETPNSPEPTPWEVAQAAGLLLPRAQAAILDPADVQTVREMAETLLGPTVLAQLEEIWTRALATPDSDAQTMLDLGRAWCRALGTDPDRPAPATPPNPGGVPNHEAPLGLLAGLVAMVTDTITGKEAIAPPPASGPLATAEKASARRKAAHEAAVTVFGSTQPTRPGAQNPIAGTRPPTDKERAAASQLARALKTAAYTERLETLATSAAPPGRLIMRQALARDAQRAAGAVPSAQPWRTTHRRVLPVPPLHVGIAADISGSMKKFAAPVASAAWITARAAKTAGADNAAATVLFGEKATALVHPRHTPAAVTIFHAHDATEEVVTALDALDDALGLSQHGAARLLVIISDGRFRPDQRADAQTRLDRLAAAGCALLWLAPNHDRVRPMPPAETLTLTDPAATAHEIGTAAITALRRAHR